MAIVSIIIPIYNAEQYLAKMLDSIICQSFADFEVLMVDDGSTDSSRDIAESYAGRDTRFKFHCKKNGGVSSARNYGMENAVGEYVMFADADDRMLPEALQTMTRLFDGDTDLVMCGYIKEDPKGTVTYSVDEEWTRKLDRKEGIEQMYRPSPFDYQGYIWNKLFRKSVIDSSGIRFDEDICYNEDRLFVTDYIIAQRRGIIFDSSPVYSYCENPSSAMGSLQKEFNPDFMSDLKAMCRMYRHIRRNFDDESLVEMAQWGVFFSYGKINNMMMGNGGIRKLLQWKMRFLLAFYLSPSFLFKLLVKTRCQAI